jgi:hypothetical protein
MLSLLQLGERHLEKASQTAGAMAGGGWRGSRAALAPRCIRRAACEAEGHEPMLCKHRASSKVAPPFSISVSLSDIHALMVTQGM